MSWVKAIPILGKLVLAVLEACQKRQRQQQAQQQEQEREAIKQNPEDRHRERFGGSAGRVSIDFDSDSERD